MKWKGLLAVLVLALPALMWAQESPLVLKTGQRDYLRYQLVDFTLSLNPGSSLTAEAMPEKLYITVWKNKRRITTVAHQDKIRLVYQDNQRWTCKWPIPFNPHLGTYTARTRAFVQGTTRTARTTFRITGRKPFNLKPGFSVVTYEGGKRGPYQTPGLNRREKPSWKNMVRWAQYMGADAFWQCLGQTQVWDKVKESEYPWSQSTLRLMPLVAKQAHELGLQYGGWITSFVVIGNAIEKSGYQFTLGYDRDKNALKQLHYISLGGQKRLEDLIGLMKLMNEDPNVDYIGLDYMRTDFGGYEFADEFVNDMGIPKPPLWTQWSPHEKALWMARLIEVTRDKTARAQWEWWRAHKVGMTIAYLLKEVKPVKPVWVFSLGWYTGHQHGQDLMMMLDAGISFNAPMFYSITRQDFPYMLTAWRRYLHHGKGSVVIGQCVDWNLLGRTTQPAGPMEHLLRQEEAVTALFKPAKSLGLFWHDLNRAFFGARGPYGTMEWATAGAASFSRLKAKADRYPFRVTMKAPKQIILGQKAAMQVTITNPGGNTLNALAVGLVPTARLTALEKGPVKTRALGPGQAQTVRLPFQVDQRYEKNGGQQMVAFRIEQPQQPNSPYVDMTYLPVTPTAAVLAPEAAAGAEATPVSPAATTR